MAVQNRYNFIRWSDGVTTTTVAGDFLEADFDADDFLISSTVSASPEDFGDLPRPYVMDRERCGYLPVLLNSDPLAFYLNTPNGLALGTFSDLRLRIINAQGATVVSDAGVLQQDVVSGANYNVFCTMTVPALAPGLYRLQIHSQSTGDTILTSNYLWARNDSRVRYETLLTRFRNDRLFYNVRYASIPGFYQQFRLAINVLERLYENDKQTYSAVTTGKTRNLENYLRRYYRFETYYFDPPAHEACAIMIEHAEVQFNGMNLTSKSPYKEASDNLMLAGKGEFEMYDVDYASVNRCGAGSVFILGTGTPGEALGTGVTDEVLSIGG
jgi:hypothetical protein